MYNNSKIITTLRISSEFANCWNELLEPGYILHDTKRLFMHANRPYFEYYLHNLDLIQCNDKDLINCRDQFLLDFIGAKKKSVDIIQQTDYVNIIKEKARTAKNILVVTTPRRTPSVRRFINGLKIKTGINYLTIDELVSECEIEPGWHIVREYFRDNHVDMVLVALGWERVVYLARFKKLFNLTALDLGDFSFTQLFKFRLKENTKKLAKSILTLFRVIK